MYTTSLPGQGPPRARRLAQEVLGVFKLRIGVMIMITALVGLAVTPGPALSFVQWVVLALSVFVSSASAGAFNQYVERDADRLMARNGALIEGLVAYRRALLEARPHLAEMIVNVGRGNELP